MTAKAIAQAIQDLEDAWIEVCTADINMSADEFEIRMRRRNRKTGIRYSENWFAETRKKLDDSSFPQRIRNLILLECDPPVLRKSHRKFERAIAKLVGFAEFTYQPLKEFVADSSKDEYLRRFVWFRAFLAAEAHHLENQRHRNTGKEDIGINNLMPRVVLKQVKT